jgi:hypothetical protein
MADRQTAVRTIVEVMWEHAEEAAVSDFLNPKPDYTQQNSHVLLGTATLATIVRTLATVQITPDEVLAAVHEWASELGEDEPPAYRGDYLRNWQDAAAKK